MSSGTPAVKNIPGNREREFTETDKRKLFNHLPLNRDERMNTRLTFPGLEIQVEIQNGC